MSRDTILAEVSAERERQDGLFGGAPHDDSHTATDWVSILVRHLGLAVDDGSPAGVCLMNDHCAGADPVRYRRQMVRVAAVAVAAIETWDRKVGEADHAPPAAEPEADRAAWWRSSPDPLAAWWRAEASRIAAETGGRVYVVEEDDRKRDAWSRGTFAVAEAFATVYERTNAVLVVDPEKGGPA